MKWVSCGHSITKIYHCAATLEQDSVCLRHVFLTLLDAIETRPNTIAASDEGQRPKPEPTMDRSLNQLVRSQHKVRKSGCGLPLLRQQEPHFLFQGQNTVTFVAKTAPKRGQKVNLRSKSSVVCLIHAELMLLKQEMATWELIRSVILF